MFRDAVFSLKDAPHVQDIRAVGLAAAIELEPLAGAPGKRGYEALQKAFFEQSMVVRISGDTVVLIPALIAGEAELSRMAEGVRAVFETLE